MEVVPGAYGTPKVVVDYAHTPDALEKVLTGLAAQCRGRLICVAGCGGNRDRGKRPEMAQVASNLSDHLWLTSDNPRDEAPADILHDMLSGLSMEQRQHASAVEDRGAAIAQAVRSASVDDLVVIAGKGHEDTQEIAGVKYPFSDVAYVENMFKENA
jgi:UDP-N-acetylmuramoyl-L-alanyl-D-glutamate--2,6-diaminopimelate ligase